MSSTICIVGRSNVGKSTLFNRLVGRNKSLVHDFPGVTRDPMASSGRVGRSRHRFVDTGGINNPLEVDQVEAFVSEQAVLSAQKADVILLVFDGQQGLTGKDQEILSQIRPLGKPIVGVINKIDPGSRNTFQSEFHALGLPYLIEISAAHKIGLEELKEAVSVCIAGLPERPETSTDETKRKRAVKVLFVGRPNVGKSSLINSILEKPALIVSERAGTTRDVVDTYFEMDGQPYILLDTAGMRKKAKIVDDLERVSVNSSLRSLDIADVVILVTTVEDEVTSQDRRIANTVIAKGRGMIVVINKWDLVSDTETARSKARDEFYFRAPFLRFADVQFSSAKTGEGVLSILRSATKLHIRSKKNFSKEKLDSVFEDILDENPPRGKKGFHLRLYSLIRSSEPGMVFVVGCNRPDLVDKNYARRWKNLLQKKLSLKGIPVQVIFRNRPAKRKRQK